MNTVAAISIVILSITCVEGAERINNVPDALWCNGYLLQEKLTIPADKQNDYTVARACFRPVAGTRNINVICPGIVKASGSNQYPLSIYADTDSSDLKEVVYKVAKTAECGNDCSVSKLFECKADGWHTTDNYDNALIIKAVPFYWGKETLKKQEFTCVNFCYKKFDTANVCLSTVAEKACPLN